MISYYQIMDKITFNITHKTYDLTSDAQKKKKKKKRKKEKKIGKTE